MKNTFTKSALASALALATANATAFELPTGRDDLDVQVYGEIRAKAVYDASSDEDRVTSEAMNLNATHGGLTGPRGYVENPTGEFAKNDKKTTDGTLTGSRIGVVARHDNGTLARIEKEFEDYHYEENGLDGLRHAYVEHGGWLVGQTTTNVFSEMGHIDSADRYGAPGQAYERRLPQVRYSADSWAVSLEMADTVAHGVSYTFDGLDTSSDPNDQTPHIGGIDTYVVQTLPAYYNPNAISRTDNKLPALTARFEDRFVKDRIGVSVAGVVQQIDVTSEIQGEVVEVAPGQYGYENGMAANQGGIFTPELADDTAVGFGVFTAGDFRVNDQVTVHASAFYSDGANSFANHTGHSYENHYSEGRVDALGESNPITAVDAVVDYRDGSADTLSTFGAQIGASWKVGPGVLAASYGFSEVNWDDHTEFQGAGDLPTEAQFEQANQSGMPGVFDASNMQAINGAWVTKRNETLFVNYRWEMFDGWKTGVELAHLRRTTQNDETASGTQLNASVSYAF